MMQYYEQSLNLSKAKLFSEHYNIKIYLENEYIRQPHLEKIGDSRRSLMT